MKEFAKSFYNSKKWKACRNSYIQYRIMIDGGLCEECHERPGFIVHHKQLLTPENINDPDTSLNHDMLEYVCKECHDRFDDHFVRCAKPKCMFLPNGQPLPPFFE